MGRRVPATVRGSAKSPQPYATYEHSLLQGTLDETRLAVDHSNVAQDLVLLLGISSQLIKLGIVLRQLGHKLIPTGNVGEGGRDEGVGRKGSEALGERGERGKGRGVGGDEAREDGKLASNVRAGEIVGGVGLLRAMER